MASKVLNVFYKDDDILMEAVKKVQSKNYHIEEVFCPFPVHGLDKLLKVKHTRLAITSFLYGLVGISVALTMMNYIMIIDWPQNIGGKPSFSLIENLPSFIPTAFEMTVFFAAHLMVITFYMRSKLWPFKKAENPDPRTTDDHFLMQVSVGDNDIQEVAEFLNTTGAVEIDLKK